MSSEPPLASEGMDMRIEFFVGVVVQVKGISVIFKIFLWSFMQIDSSPRKIIEHCKKTRNNGNQFFLLPYN
jgi:hypothetical protein